MTISPRLAYLYQRGSGPMQEFGSLIVFAVAMGIVAAIGLYLAEKERKQGQQRR